MVLRALNLYVMIKFYFISYFHVCLFYLFFKVSWGLWDCQIRCLQMCYSHPLLFISYLCFAATWTPWSIFTSFKVDFQEGEANAFFSFLCKHFRSLRFSKFPNKKCHLKAQLSVSVVIPHVVTTCFLWVTVALEGANIWIWSITFLKWGWCDGFPSLINHCVHSTSCSGNVTMQTGKSLQPFLYFPTSDGSGPSRARGPDWSQ